MAKCVCCGAPLNENDRFCAECGTVVTYNPAQDPQPPAAEEVPAPEQPACGPSWEQNGAQPTYQQPYAQNGAQPTYPQPYAQSVVQPTYQQPYAQNGAQPTYQQPYAQNGAQPTYQQPWAQNGAQPTYRQPTFVVPKRPLGKGGGVTMIVFGSILLGFFTLFTLAMCSSVSKNNFNRTDSCAEMTGPMLALFCTVFLGGLLLLIFGIRKIKNVNRYNQSLRE